MEIFLLRKIKKSKKQFHRYLVLHNAQSHYYIDVHKIFNEIREVIPDSCSPHVHESDDKGLENGYIKWGIHGYSVERVIQVRDKIIREVKRINGRMGGKFISVNSNRIW